MPRWYALRTRARTEKVVDDQLRRRGMESFLPLIMRVSQWKDRCKRIEWLLFPGYCFARFSHDQRLVILQSPGVVEIIGSAHGQSEPIPDDEIGGIQRVVSGRLPYDAYPHFAEGMAVQVVRGPLLGLHGTLVRKSDGCRLVVRVNLIGQATAVHIDADDVTPLPSFDAVMPCAGDRVGP